MFLGDIPVNYWAVLVAAIVFYILGAIWYSPLLFAGTCMKQEEPGMTEEQKKACSKCRATGFVGEFICSLVIAFVLALFIQISEAETVIEGITVALWAWLGFIVTTHLSGVFWGNRTFKHYLVHVVFLLIGFIVMGAILIGMGVP